MNNLPIGIFDSGVGGLGVLSVCKRQFSNENFIYLFDKSHSPYGNKSNSYIIKRAIQNTKFLIDKGVKCVIIGCNTASVLALDKIKSRFSIPIIGVIPPIKVSLEQINDGKILVLCTSRTAKSKKIKNMVKNQTNIILSPQKKLAHLIDENFNKLGNIKPYINQILSQYNDVKSVILGCTHYHYIKPFIQQYYNNEIAIFDSVDYLQSDINLALLKVGKNNCISRAPHTTYYYI